MDLLCFSHLRWDFVYQRPQHLMSRFKNCYTVYFIEESIFYDGGDNYTCQLTKENVTVIKPHLNCNDTSNHNQRLKNIIDAFVEEQQIENFIAWYYSPIALLYTAHLHSALTVYDCMDKLSAF